MVLILIITPLGIFSSQGNSNSHKTNHKFCFQTTLSLSLFQHNALFQKTDEKDGSSICTRFVWLPLATSHSCPHFCVVHSDLFRTDNASTDVLRSVPPDFFYSQFPNETSSRAPIVGISSVHLGFNRKTHHYCCEQLYNFETIAAWAGYQPTFTSPFHHIIAPPVTVDNPRSRI